MGCLSQRIPYPSRVLSPALSATLLCILCSVSHGKLADLRLHRRPDGSPHFKQIQSSKCLTYGERYASASQSLGARTTVQEEASVAVLIRFYAAEKVKDDSVNSLRTIILETERRGYHAFIFYELKGEHDHPKKVEAVRNNLPSDLRRHIFFWQESAIMRSYPSLNAEAWQMESLGGVGWGVGPTAAYLPLNLFMREHLEYDFAWVLEEDVRYIGDWGEFFRSAYAVAGTSLDDSERGRQFEQDLNNGFVNVSNFEASASSPSPGLITFAEVVYDSEKWAVTAHGLQRPYAETVHMAWGGSRNLFEAMERVSREGAYAYYEMFMPTVAVMSNLTIVELSLYGEFFSCCDVAAEELYRDWYLDKHRCHTNKLLHPIKLEDECVWRRQSVRRHGARKGIDRPHCS